MVFPDTSPRNVNVEGVYECYGEGASYYVDTSSDSYKKHYQMFTYLTEELPKVIKFNFPIDEGKPSITGWSMGGLGAILCGLKTDKYRSVTALSPISDTENSQNYTVKAFHQYFQNYEE